MPRRAYGSGGFDWQGYKLVHINGRHVREHVAVMEKKLGRRLQSGEIVHHRDKNEANNSPDNLVYCPNQLFHRWLHKTARQLNMLEDLEKILPFPPGKR